MTVFSNSFLKGFIRSLALLLAGILIGIVAAAPFFPYAGMYSSFDAPHDHSVAYADNGRDFSRLTAYAGQPTDSIIVVCDNTSNGNRAVGRAFDNGNLIATVTAGGAGTCSDKFTGRNNSAHDACNAAGSGCGPNSNHGT